MPRRLSTCCVACLWQEVPGRSFGCHAEGWPCACQAASSWSREVVAKASRENDDIETGWDRMGLGGVIRMCPPPTWVVTLLWMMERYGKVKYVMISVFTCVLQILVPGRGVCGIGMDIVCMWTPFAVSYCITICYYCFVLCLDSGLYSCNMYVYSVIIAFIISCIKGCGVRRGRWNVSNQLQTRTLTPARRDAILKGDLPVCWPRGNVQIQFLNFADDCSACWQAPQMQTQRLVLIWMLPGECRRFYGCSSLVASHISIQVH